MLRIAFRVDTDSNLRRCLALASGMEETEPCEIHFLVSGKAAIKYPCRDLGSTSLPSWDLEATAQAVDELGIGLLVVDERVDGKFLETMQSKTVVAVFDESNGLKHYPAHAIINPNINAHTLEYSCGKETLLLLGTEFTPLPAEFDEFQEFTRSNPEKARRILVCFSGPDQQGATISAVRALKKLGGRFIAEILTDKGFMHGEALAREIGLDDRFLVINDESNRARRMAAADLAISFPDFHELLMLSLPCALVSDSPAHSILAEYAARMGFAIPLGESKNMAPAPETLGRLIADKAQRDRISARANGLVDGLGRFRLAEELLRLGKKESI